MNNGPNHPSGHGGKGRRRRRGHRGHGGQQPQSQQQPPNQGGGKPRKHYGHGGGRPRVAGHPAGDTSIYTAPMDHSYRLQQGNGDMQNQRRGGRPGFPPRNFQQQPEPVPNGHESAATRIYCFVDDLFFLTKIQDTARKLNVKVEFVKTDKDIFDRVSQNGDEKPSLIIFDLNNLNAKPLTTIPKLKAKLKKETTIIGFVSHVQGELKLKAQEAGCDVVIPRSAFSQNLPQLLRRHGAPEELDETV